ncbi:MAG: class I SAM-dependent methyltransferase [Candidatus Pacebacteria bacterium]|nr:class I SAM-dependent methyltransferase [Candidatus Paceibacterota bacterium]
MNEKYAKYLLNKTQSDYNRIAEHFSKTRTSIWKELEYFLQFVSGGESVLDLGCGNGRLLNLFKDKNIIYVGIDNSEKLIKIAEKNQKATTAPPNHPFKGKDYITKIKNQNEKSKFKKTKFIIGNGLDLPFENNCFDKIFSIAVLHHIPSPKFRLEFLKQAKRVLKPNGLLILTVWNLYHKKYLKYHLKYFFLKLTGKSKLDFKDIFYPWKNQKSEVLTQRYIHCFTKIELKNLAEKAGFKVKEIGFLGKNKRNIYLIAK